jgi:acetone carboxylase gamma subunit
MAEEKTSWSKVVLKDLIEGKLDPDTLRRVHVQPKDEDRFEKIIEIEQERVPWVEKIIAPLAEHLYVVLKGEERIVKCTCGHEFGDYRQNWKFNALVYERNPQDGEIYLGPRAADPAWAVIREYYCPSCATQLEVEAVPPGFPIVFDAQLDIDGFYGKRPKLKKKIFGR